MSILCNMFTILESELDQPGVKTFRFTTDTGEKKVICIDLHGEMIAISALPIRAPALMSRLADRGFFISPYRGSLQSFFHALIFPEDVKTTVGIKIQVQVQDLPEGLDVELVSSYDEIDTDSRIERL